MLFIDIYTLLCSQEICECNSKLWIWETFFQRLLNVFTFHWLHVDSKQKIFRTSIWVRLIEQVEWNLLLASYGLEESHLICEFARIWKCLSLLMKQLVIESAVKRRKVDVDQKTYNLQAIKCSAIFRYKCFLYQNINTSEPNKKSDNTFYF